MTTVEPLSKPAVPTPETTWPTMSAVEVGATVEITEVS